MKADADLDAARKLHMTKCRQCRINKRKRIQSSKMFAEITLLSIQATREVLR